MGESCSCNKLFNGGKLSAEFFEDIKQAVISTFGTICNERPVFVGPKETGLQEDVIVGIMSLVNKDCPLTLHLGFTRDSAQGIAKKFARAEVAFESQDMCDLVGELSNIFSGDVSGRLEVWGIKNDLSIPTVVRGKEIELMLPANAPEGCLQFRLSCGDFWLRAGVGRPDLRK